MMTASTLIVSFLLFVPQAVQPFQYHHSNGVSNSRRPTGATAVVQQQFVSSSSSSLTSFLPPQQTRNNNSYHVSGKRVVLMSSPQDDSDDTKSSSSTPVTTPTSTTTTATTTPLSTTVKKGAQKLWLKVNDVGASFKPKAQEASSRGYVATTKSAQFGYGLKACLYYSLFILYRAYRGFFVLLPAVFREVYVRMEDAMKSSNMALIEAEENELDVTGRAEDGSSDVVYKPRQTWRTRLTVSVLAAVVTASYMIGGTVQMATNFIKTLTSSSSVPKSFEAAADGMVDYESKIGKIGGAQINGAAPTSGGDDGNDNDKLTP